MPRLNLLVLRSRNASRLADFYSHLGLKFELHRHGSGPEHFAAEEAGCVFEIYPARQESEATSGLRLGFAVENVPETVARLVEAGAEVVSGPAMSPWGLRAVVKDLEGHRVELTEETTEPQ